MFCIHVLTTYRKFYMFYNVKNLNWNFFHEILHHIDNKVTAHVLQIENKSHYKLIFSRPQFY